jgi:hypothetical protein
MQLSSTTLLETPTINTVADDTDTSILVYYTGVSGADSYVLTISLPATTTDVAIDYAPTNATIVSPSTGAIAITGLVGSTTYVFSMKAKQGTDIFSAASGTQSYTTKSAAPTVTISNITSTSMTITCSAITNATYYATATPPYAYDVNNELTVSANSNTTTISLASLSPETVYSIAVYATVSGVNTFTTVVFATTLEDTMLFWIDANDPYNTTVMPGYSSNVTSATNKSISGGTLSRVGTVQYFNNSFNNYPCWTISNTQSYLSKLLTYNKNTLTVFTVFQMSASSQTTGRIVSLGASTSTNDHLSVASMGVFRDSNTSNITTVRNQYDITKTTNLVINTPYVFGTWYDGTNNYSIVQNGGDAITPTTNTSTGNFGISKCYIGSSTNTADTTTDQFYGNIAEIIIYGAALTKSQRQIVEGYLSWKWGLQSKLPTLHPYSTTKIDVASDYVCRFYSENSGIIPIETQAGTGYTTKYEIINNGAINVSIANITSRPSVFKFSGSNALSILHRPPSVIFTTTFWLYCDSSSSTRRDILVSSAVNMYLSMNGYLYIESSDIIQSTIIQSTAWKFYTIVRNSTYLLLYINGNLCSSIKTTSSYGSNSSENYTIIGPLANNASFISYMDDIRLYERPLSSSEILILYTSSMLNAPTSVALVSNSATTTSASMTFTGSAGAASYTLTATTGTTVISSTATSSPATISGLSPGTTYTVVMVAVNDNFTSVVSSSVSVTTIPNATTISAATAISSSSISVTYAIISGLTYTLKATATGQTTVTLTGKTTSPISLPNLTPNTTYTISVVAVNSGGSSAEVTKNVSTMKTFSYSYSVPTNLVATTSGTITTLKFIGPGTLTIPANTESRTCNLLLVGGGGGGGGSVGGEGGGGGGGGELGVTSSFVLSSSTTSSVNYSRTYNMYIGSGGKSNSGQNPIGINGSDTAIIQSDSNDSNTATEYSVLGGGEGGTACDSSSAYKAITGGSSGGSTGYKNLSTTSPAGSTGGAATSYTPLTRVANKGGNGIAYGGGGGGGGASGAGSNGSGQGISPGNIAGNGGSGGAGYNWIINGTSYGYYGGGGGGGASCGTNSGTTILTYGGTSSAGGTTTNGGGGAGSNANTNANATSGTVNTGGGGGGVSGNSSTASSGAGGTGLIIIVYTT